MPRKTSNRGPATVDQQPWTSSRERTTVSRRYGEPIAVWTSETSPGAPQRFRWRRHTYAVTEVLGRWVEAARWWQSGSGAAGAESGPTGQRLLWRVEARSGTRTGVFDLCRTPAGWSLRAVLD